MKMKLNFGEGGIKGFLARNCEKIVFALAVLAVIWVALPSSEHKPVGDELSPKRLDEQVTNANRHLETDQWSVIEKLRFSAPDDYLAKIPQDAVSAGSYLADVPLDKPLFPSAKKRQDPDLYPVGKLQIAVAVGPVVENFKAAEDADEEAAAEPEYETFPLPPSFERRFKISNTVGDRETTKTFGRIIVGLTGLIPYKAQKEEFKARFADSTSYSSERDSPKYGAGDEKPGFGRIYYLVERAEVAPDGTVGTWGKLAYSSDAYFQQQKWPTASADSDLADPLAVDPRFSMRVPPLLLRDLQPLALHSDIRTAAAAKEAASQNSAAPTVEPTSPEEDPLAVGDGPATESGPSTEGPAPSPRHGADREDPQFTGGATRTAEDVEYKLFRYFDMTAEPGKAYVYRVKLFLEDPNDPEIDSKATSATVSRKPPQASLDKTVIERLARKTNAKIWWRETPFSEVSPVARIPASKQVLAGKFDPGKIVRPKGQQFEIVQAEPQVNLMVLLWDAAMAMDVPGVQEASRGSVVNFKTETKAVDAGRRLLVKLPNYTFNTENLVLDLRGGEESRNKLATPGEVLLMDGDGKLIVRNELEDASTYQDHVFPEEPKAAAEEPPMPDEGREPDKRRPPRTGANPPPPERRPRTRPSGEDGDILN